ncbi:hypothetical protein TanjilG_00650 [Lupinus angustifolius]|uniref:Uncharacterized protein n=1 Tax=Lupinus angustifolius TaxID=3871 RepID=A0A4P1R854_LUPAN|nr:hypothetical protein TanjilG_00650 [Lupinus angustifolius]
MSLNALVMLLSLWPGGYAFKSWKRNFCLRGSDIRLSFIGDDGKIERLFTLASKSQCAAVVVDEIPTDSSGRSFLVRTPHSRTLYFWCSEKSKLLGVELLAKMRDLMKRKASIAELSGISRSRLDCFASQLRAFLVGSAGYLVNAGPAMPTSIPQLLPKLVKPLISESDAVVKGTRETLRLLISGSSQGNQQVMMDPLPAILTNPNDKQNNILVAASCGLYNDTRDIDVIANNIAAMGLASLSGLSMGEGDSKVCDYYGMSESEVRILSDSSSTFLDDKGDPPLDSSQ